MDYNSLGFEFATLLQDRSFLRCRVNLKENVTKSILFCSESLRFVFFSFLFQEAQCQSQEQLEQYFLQRKDISFLLSVGYDQVFLTDCNEYDCVQKFSFLLVQLEVLFSKSKIDLDLTRCFSYFLVKLTELLQMKSQEYHLLQ